ncbi:hypothetical protein SAMN03159390_01860 [Pseudomonas sp. NFACC49-2]|nr:hypothetical protein [Pseudomonas sp. NFACC49-2]SFX58467.1 hypothetical protein SAMN03159390_01860 [Pseudomonas sp. NFACC49-2]
MKSKLFCALTLSVLASHGFAADGFDHTASTSVAADGSDRTDSARID